METKSPYVVELVADSKIFSKFEDLVSSQAKLKPDDKGKTLFGAKDQGIS